MRDLSMAALRRTTAKNEQPLATPEEEGCVVHARESCQECQSYHDDTGEAPGTLYELRMWRTDPAWWRRFMEHERASALAFNGVDV